MYVTRPLSQLLKDPKSLSTQPDGPNSGFLVIKDEETNETSCFGHCTSRTNRIKNLPFPQNMDLTISYSKKVGDKPQFYYEPMIFIPVLNQPLSFNRYYVIPAVGPNKGKALHGSNQRNTICYPTPLDPRNVYQQVQISGCGCYDAVSVAIDGYCPYHLSHCTRSWSLYAKDAYHFELEEANGVDSELRASFLKDELSFSLSCKSSEPVEKDGRARDQVERSLYYVVALELRWERVFTCKRNGNGKNLGNSVVVDVGVEKQQVCIAGYKASWNEKSACDGVIWFTNYGMEGPGLSVGLRVEVVERMKYEQERLGWKCWVDERRGRIKRVEEFKGGEGKDWEEFGCYVLVERFNLIRMDGSVGMSYDFTHSHQIKTIWEEKSCISGSPRQINSLKSSLTVTSATCKSSPAVTSKKYKLSLAVTSGNHESSAVTPENESWKVDTVLWSIAIFLLSFVSIFSYILNYTRAKRCRKKGAFGIKIKTRT